MNIDVTYFALMKEKAGRSHERLSLEPDATAQDLYQLVADKYRISVPLDAIRVAVNDEFADLTTKLTDGDKVVFIPPVSGG
jgi:sulfur-carrier protein